MSPRTVADAELLWSQPSVAAGALARVVLREKALSSRPQWGACPELVEGDLPFARTNSNPRLDHHPYPSAGNHDPHSCETRIFLPPNLPKEHPRNTPHRAHPTSKVTIG